MRVLDPWKVDLRGTSLIEASAGTGKTYTLTTLFVRLLVEENLEPDRILVMTFTQAATAELRERVRARIVEAIESLDPAPGDEQDPKLQALAQRARDEAAASGRPDPLRRALQSFDDAAIQTIHGFCQRTLQRYAFESGLPFDADLVEKPEALERTLAHDLWSRLLRDLPRNFVEWLSVGEGRRWQFTPTALQALLSRDLGADETMPILPPRAQSLPDLDRFDADVLRAFEDWAATWRARRGAMEALLENDPPLNRRWYKPERFRDDWGPQLDALASAIEALPAGAGGGEPSCPKAFAWFTNERIVKHTTGKRSPIEDPLFEVADVVVAALAARTRARGEVALDLRHRFVEAAREHARRRREEQHVLFFDDLLSELRRALEGPSGEDLAEKLREQHPFALIDEFQDTDPVQYEIFRRVWHAGERSRTARGMVLIGDPKQAVYSFRDADVFTYLKAREDARENVASLPVNWRSDPGLIAAVNALFQRRPASFCLEQIGFDPVRPQPGAASQLRAPGRSEAGLRVLMAERAQTVGFFDESISVDKPLPTRFGRTALMRAMATDVADLLDAGATLDGEPIRPSDIAVLARRKLELQQARRELERVGIPCVDRGDANVFDAREAWELVSVLQAMIRFGDPVTLRGALSTGAIGLDAVALLALGEQSEELTEISGRYAEYGRLWQRQGFGYAFETWRRREGVVPRLLAYQDGDRRLTNWLHLAELLSRVESERTPSRAGLVAWLEGAIAAPEARGEVGGEASLQRLERDDQAVSLVTLHSSKGLQYPIVYLPSLWEGAKDNARPARPVDDGKRQIPPVRFHETKTGRRSLDLAGHDDYDDHCVRAADETFSEQLRLLYVGLTRAKHQCVVSWGAFGKACAASPLAWLLAGSGVAGEVLERTAEAEAIFGWSDGEWREAWEALRTAAGAGAVSLEAAVLEPRERWQAPSVLRPALDFVPRSRRLGRARRTTSFSGLLREGQRIAVAGPEVLGRDVDAVSDAIADPRSDEPRLPDLAAEMHAFPRGAEAGTLLHGVLERADLRGGSDTELEALVLGELDRAGFDRGLAPQVEHVVRSVACTPLDDSPSPLRLSDVASRAWRPEMEFTLATPGGTVGLSPSTLADLLAGLDPVSPLGRYADRVRGMGFEALDGFLRGFIDVVFSDGDRYYLIDYKSNHLGDHQRDYAPAALVQPMIDHDYVLQYLLYTLALDRHLRARLVDYDYERHFGGVYYLFLRGLSETHAPECGVFQDRPPPELVEAVSALIGVGDGAAEVRA